MSISSPAQSDPPLAGAGLEQVLVLDWEPPPHVTEQRPKSLHSDHIPATIMRNKNIGKRRQYQGNFFTRPGHALVLHSSISVFSPTQSEPPLAGAGLEQVRLLE